MQPVGELQRLSSTDILDARRRIAGYIHQTPIVRSSALDTRTNSRLYFKCENLQRSGAFKARGAFNAIRLLCSSSTPVGVVTSSSGNQAAALCLAAMTNGVPAHVVMPRSARAAKVRAVERYGGHIVWLESQTPYPSDEEYEAAVAAVRQEIGAEVIHPYNDLRTIAGQGTCALEFLEELPELDLLLVPVGGGGLIAGAALIAKALKPSIRVIGCEPEGADDARQSFRAGARVPQLAPRTIADGLRTSLGTLTFPLVMRYVDDIVTVSERAIVDAMRLTWEILKVLIEPSSAVPVAAVLADQVAVSGKQVGIILSGGNVDLDSLPWHRTETR